MSEPVRTRPIGSIIGAVGGLVFVLVNAGAAPLSVAWRIAAVAAFVAIAWFLVLPQSAVRHPLPARGALRTYAVSVVAMVVSIPVGASIITNVFDRPDAVLIWVVFVVAVHFVPFARAFGMRVFYWLALTLVVVAIAGGVLTLGFDHPNGSGQTGVAAGVVLLAFSAAGPRTVGGRSPARRPDVTPGSSASSR